MRFYLQESARVVLARSNEKKKKATTSVLPECTVGAKYEYALQRATLEFFSAFIFLSCSRSSGSELPAIVHFFFSFFHRRHFFFSTFLKKRCRCSRYTGPSALLLCPSSSWSSFVFTAVRLCVRVGSRGRIAQQGASSVRISHKKLRLTPQLSSGTLSRKQ